MKRALLFGFATILALLLWAVLVIVAARYGWMLSTPAKRGDTAGFMRFAVSRYTERPKGNIVILLVDHGRIAETYANSVGRAVDANSLFQVASLSKWLTAWGVMSLFEAHRIELDAPVSRYLTRWRLPPSPFDNSQVTVRRLLSHSAGLTDGLGFAGYPPGTPLPTIEHELSHAADAEPGASGEVRVGAQPGSTWRYSGGGYLLLQLIIEEVTHQTFNDYMRSAILGPLGMSESTFVDPDLEHLVDFYSEDGSKAIHYRYTAQSAASLYTSVSDLARFLQAQFEGLNGEPSGRGVLNPETVHMMRTPQSTLLGIPFWGLGQALYAPDGAGGFVTGHDGGNDPAINTTARINPANGDGIIVLETGSTELASKIGSEWTYWQTGKRPLDAMIRFDSQRILLMFATGALIIVVASIALGIRTRSRKRPLT